jgi:hypothetical protein
MPRKKKKSFLVWVIVSLFKLSFMLVKFLINLVPQKVEVPTKKPTIACAHCGSRKTQLVGMVVDQDFEGVENVREETEWKFTKPKNKKALEKWSKQKYCFKCGIIE